MSSSTCLNETHEVLTDQVKSSSSKREPLLKRMLREALIYWLVISIPCVSLALPVPRVFVVPPLGDGQTQSGQIGRRLSSSLKEYLKKSKRLKLEDGKAKPRESKDGRLMEAESLKVSSIDLYKEGKFEEARAGFVSSLKGFQKSVASIRDMKSVYQTLYYAAAACMALEYDDDAKDYLRQLAAISPEGDFETIVPAKVKKKYKRERKRLLKKKRGAIAIETIPAGAKIWVNGEESCVSPCEIKDLPRGQHYIWAEKKGAGKAGSIAKVKAGWSSPLKYNLKQANIEKSTEPVSKELLAQLQEKLSKGLVDGQLKEFLDQIAEDQEVGYTVFLYILSKKRNVKLFSFVYDFNEKKTVATKPFQFKANFSATRITAMKLVKEVEKIVKIFPEDKNIDGIYQPLLDALTQAKQTAKAAVVIPPKPPIAVVPPVIAVPPLAPSLPIPKAVDPKPVIDKQKQPKPLPQVASRPQITPPSPNQFKPPKKSIPLLPPPQVPTQANNDDSGILGNPWFWTGLSVVLVAGATTGAVLLLDAPSENQSYQSRVNW